MTSLQPKETTSYCQDISKNESKHTMSARTTVFGLLNGMIGGTCLVIPLMGIKTGWLASILICTIIGCISYYTAYLIVLHLGKGTQIRDSILSHFNNDYKYMTGYSLLIWFSFMPFMLIYFRIICLQIEGLMGHQSVWVGPIAAVTLIILIIFVRIYHIGEQTLAFGIISIIGYLLFLTWAQLSAPEGQQRVPLFGQVMKLASTLIMAETIHDFLVANIIKNPNRHQYHSTVRWTFFIGSSIYSFIALGSLAIVNRVPFKSDPETINDYFRPGEWQNTIIEAIYLVNMVTTYPNYLIISKLRFFQMFDIELQQRISKKEVIYICTIVLVSFLGYVSGVHLDVMISLNGAVVGFTYVVVIPIWLHFKCIFFDRSSGYIENDPEWNSTIVPNKCQCDNVYKNKFMLYLQTVFLVFVMIFGIVLMIVTITNVSNSPTENQN